MTPAVFVQIRCTPGTTYKVADEIARRELYSELYSTSGDYDLLMKLYVPKDKDIGQFLDENLFDIPDIKRTLTTFTFNAF